jgi:phage gp36-like protein
VYASVSDMVDRCGEQELIRLTTPDGQPLEALDADAVERALKEASALADSYLRRRYQVPADVAPAELTNAVCKLARYDLMSGEQKTPSESAQRDRKEALDWLRDISTGKALLDLAEIDTGDDSHAQMQDRPAVFS